MLLIDVNKKLHFQFRYTQIVATLRKPSLAEGWKGDEQMQEVSLESPFLVSLADIGDKLVKFVADLLPSLRRSTAEELD